MRVKFASNELCEVRVIRHCEVRSPVVIIPDGHGSGLLLQSRLQGVSSDSELVWVIDSGHSEEGRSGRSLFTGGG